MKSSHHNLTHTFFRTISPLALALMVALFIFLTARPAMAAPNAQESQAQTFLVHLVEGTTLETRDALVAEMGGELVTWMPQINVAEIRLPVQEGVMVASLPSMANGIVTYAENDLVVEATMLPNDPDFSDEAMSYGFEQVDALDAWDITTGSQGIVIAVVDSGVKLDHPEFAGRLTAGYDFVNHDDQADDDVGHGTHVAGVIAANCRLMPVKVLNENNLGSWSQLAQGILFAVDNGARVINLSLGAATPSETLASAVQYALDMGVIVVAAAGNNGADAPFYPASLDGVIAVGATNNAGERWSRSNFGSYVDLVAPGALIYSTYNDMNNLYHGYTYMSGTSMATPFVSGVAGLLLSVNGGLSVQQVTDAMITSAEDLGAAGWDAEFSNGRVSALGALMSPIVGLVEDKGDVAAPGQTARIFLPMLGNN
jgi:thermitase